MKKFVAKIEVWLDDSEYTVKANGVTNTYLRPPDRTDGPEMFFQIKLPPNTKGNDPDTLAHELGHVVAHIYKTPAATTDDLAQTLGGVLSMIAPLNIGDFKGAMSIKLEAEKEAWEIAHKIYPNINPADEREALNSYEEGLAKATK